MSSNRTEPRELGALEKVSLTHLLKNTILHICQANSGYDGKLEVDGIICITGESEGEQLVVKVHEEVNTVHRPQYLRNDLQDAGYGETLERTFASWKRRKVQIHPKEEDRMSENGDSGLSQSGLVQIDNAKTCIGKDQNFDKHTKSNVPYSSSSSSHVARHGFLGMNNDRWSTSSLLSEPECKACGYIFDNFEVLSEHNEAAHSAYTCQFCYKTFTSRSNLERHSRLHTGHKPYVCAICGKAFSRKDHLSNHATKHAFKCGTCSKRFSEKKMLVSHYSYDHGMTLTNICDFCNKGFTSIESYEEHVKVHPQFLQSGTSSRQVGSDDGNESVCSPLNLASKKYSCKSCSYNSPNKVSLLKHQTLHSRENKVFCCLACPDLSFDDPFLYEEHLATHNNCIDIFECCICSTVCQTFQALKEHEQFHVDDELDIYYDRHKEPVISNRHKEPVISNRHKEPVISNSHKEPVISTDIYYNSQKEPIISTAQHISLEPQLGHYNKVVDSKMSVCPNKFERSEELHQQREAFTSERGKSFPFSIRENKRKQREPRSIRSLKEYEEGDVTIVEMDTKSTHPSIFEDNQASFSSESSRCVSTENLTSITKNTRFSNAETCSVNEKYIPDSSDLERRSVRPLSLCESPEGDEQTPLNICMAANQLGAEHFHSSSTNGSSNNLGSLGVPQGPHPCSVCNFVSNNFQELEMHCFGEHNRSPCMYCSKTFAQKANRDRHVCLHTGEKPYACPECNERFSRGDKLKLHRIRAHKINFPAYNKQSYEYSVSPTPPSPVSQIPFMPYSSSSSKSSSDSPQIPPEKCFDSQRCIENESVWRCTSGNSHPTGEGNIGTRFKFEVDLPMQTTSGDVHGDNGMAQNVT